MGHFWEFYIYIFDIDMLLLFRMVGLGAQGYVVYLVLDGIDPIIILVLVHEW